MSRSIRRSEGQLVQCIRTVSQPVVDMTLHWPSTRGVTLIKNMKTQDKPLQYDWLYWDSGLWTETLHMEHCSEMELN